MIAAASPSYGMQNSHQISSDGKISYGPQSVEIESFPNPSKINQKVLLTGVVTDALNAGIAENPVTIQSSRDQLRWDNVSTVSTDEMGFFETELTFPSSGVFYVRAVCGKAASLQEQVVATFFVNNNDLEDFSDIQKAIDALPSEGGVVCIRSGIYDLNGRSIVVRSNLRLIGEGTNRTVIRLYPAKQGVNATNVEDGITSKTAIDNLFVENLTLIQNVVPLNHHGGLFLRKGPNNNITLRSIKVTDVSGAGISVPSFNNLVIEDCTIERVWTGITFNDGSLGLVKQNIVVDTTGDAIGSGRHVAEIVIENNYLQNIGDTAIDISSQSWVPGNLPHENIVVRNNTLRNGGIRVTNSVNVQIINNTIEYGEIGVDAGQGYPSNVTIDGNHITSKSKAGIGFYGALNSSALNNVIVMEPPTSNVTQSGLIAAIWGTGIIENNTIFNPACYGISFGGWGLGGDSNITIRTNTLQGFDDVGIYDDAKHQQVHIKGNLIISDGPSAKWSIFTECTANQWLIECNTLRVGESVGDQTINAPNSVLTDNH